MGAFLNKLFRVDARRLKKLEEEVEHVLAYKEEMENLTDEQLQAKTQYFRDLLNDGKTLNDIKYEAYAVVREVDKRVLGEFPYRVQVMGALVLHNGDVAEMRTGEGKTLTATMPVYLNALEGKGVHVVTVNEYLATRDAEWMGRVYRFLGLTVGVNTKKLSKSEKRAAFQCDITYTTSSEIGFDYLRDNMVVSAKERVLRGLNFALIDEADSILIDEGRTPLIISGGKKAGYDYYGVADKFVKSLSPKQYTHDVKSNSAVLTEEGVKAAEKFFNLNNLYDINNTSLVHHIGQALKANFIMKRDTDYLVENGEIMLIDQNTGRKLPGRAYSDGLNQAIEAKENVKVKNETITEATITFQNFFRLYNKLSGMTGTAKTEEEELTDVYNMRVIVIPTNSPIQRIDDDDTLFRTKDEKYAALLEDIKERHAQGQPILIGTASVEVSEYLSTLLKKEGIKHEVLNAKNHEREAEIVALAGQKNAVTIATNMAGRGTDIKLGEGVAELGGLAVLGSERNDSRRVDNQLRGRAGRQGDPGYSKFYVSAQDLLFKRYGNFDKGLFGYILKDKAQTDRTLTRVINGMQRKSEGAGYDYRKHIIKYDEVLRQHREITYKLRDQLLSDDEPQIAINKMYSIAAKHIIMNSLIDVDGDLVLDQEKMREFIKSSLFMDVVFPDNFFVGVSEEEAVEKLSAELVRMFEIKFQKLPKEALYDISKQLVLRILDSHWTSHIDAMEKLKGGVGYLGYAQQSPIAAYVNRGFEMFNNMMTQAGIEATRATLHLEQFVRIVTPQGEQPLDASKREVNNA